MLGGERAANECSEPEGVAPVGDRASQGNEILDLLAAKKALASLRGYRDVAKFKRTLVTPEAGPGRRE
jgi:hypothetical protein